MNQPTTDTYGKKEVDRDYELLVRFHEDTYNGYSHTKKQIKKAHKRWWRICEYYKGEGHIPLEVMLTLLYTMKYLPSTYEDTDGQFPQG